ncbi:hypothetical protein [Anaerorhabdus furcosa]|uniref:hypothetical protein n=1 Tax=Anaerorhabdus furcosa TaxID=118967 RepID=UPI000998EBA0|nr:hypothetical protein [Anaerorhabdus furcosa]
MAEVNCYYGSYNKDCNTLAWYGVRTGVVNGNSVQFRNAPLIQNPSHTWNGSPWDYTQPSGCRVVVNNYPY